MKSRRLRKIQPFNKLHGAIAMQNAMKAIRRSKNVKRKPLVSVLSPFTIVKASSLSQIEKKIKAASRRKNCKRVFIRASLSSRIQKDRLGLWSHAPRGHLDMKTGKISWDTKPYFERKTELFEYLLYATKPREEIKGSGLIRLIKSEKGKINGLLCFPGKDPIKFKSWNIKGAGPLDAELSAFVKALIQKSYMSQCKRVILSFVRWKGEKGIEFFNFFRSQ